MTELQREYRTADLPTAKLIAWLRETAKWKDRAYDFYDDDEQEFAEEARADAALLQEVADRLELLPATGCDRSRRNI
jgi:hypothetical protein